MTGLLVTAGLVSAFIALIWFLVRQAEKVGEQGVRAALNQQSLEVLDEVNEAELGVGGMSRADVDRVLQGPQQDSD